MTSPLTSIAATQQRADQLASADRSRLAAGTSERGRSERPRRVWRLLRRRPAIA
ncbi:MAG: hypothetical protein QOH46_4264 [Solirubrobacteraceae bacterium]|nr:hypothetical protein [Solirubrobacteraceae bacterium]